MDQPVLYKRAKTGKIVSYTIWVDKTTADGNPVIMKETGQLTGKKTIHTEAVFTGKQKRTAFEQAEFQVLSDWKKKRDDGYKSLKDLGSPHTEEEWLVDNTGHDLVKFHRWLDEALPKFNTDASGNVKPMLAKDVDWDKVKFPAWVQPKLDGFRCLMVVNTDSHAEVVVKFLTRSGKEYVTLQHIVNDVLQYIVDKDITESFILDGEIYSDELSFQAVSKAAKKLRDNSLKLKLHVYDILNDKNQSERLIMAQELVNDIASPFVTFTVTELAHDKEDVIKLHDAFVSNGREGAMIRHTQGMYGYGQRSWDLLKVKEYEETEFAFKNFEFGQRGIEDLIAVLHTLDGKDEFRAKMMGNLADKEELYATNKNGEGEGKPMTIKHFGWTDDNKPRNPTGKGFRHKDDTDA